MILKHMITLAILQLIKEMITQLDVYQIIDTIPSNNIDNIPRFNAKHTFLKNFFFPSAVIEWNNLERSIASSESFSLFKKNILQFIRPPPKRTFNCHNPIEIKPIARLNLSLNHLRDHKFKHNFRDCLNPICCYGEVCYLLYYLPLFSGKRSIFLDKI